MLRFVLVVAALLLVSSCNGIVSGRQDAVPLSQDDNDTTTAAASSNNIKTALAQATRALGDRWRRRLLLQQQQSQGRRSGPPEPARVCGQIVGTVFTHEMKQFLELLAREFVPPDSRLQAFLPLAMAILESAVKYDVQASVVCASCDELMREYHQDVAAAAAFATDDDGKDGWLTYCGNDVYGANVTHSGLVFRPMDPETGQVFQRKMKAGVFMHGTTVHTRSAPSEVWPENLAEHIANNDPDEVLFDLFDCIGAMMASASGVVSIAPDYIGYGQAYEYPKSFLDVMLYQQAAVTLFLKEQHDLSLSDGCAALDNVATVGGYSEGGFAAFAAAQALDRIGVKILSVEAGAAPFDISRQVAWTIAQYDSNATLGPLTGVALAFAGNAFSSTNPDLVNSGVGQNLLADEWSNYSDYSRNVKAWMTDDYTRPQLASLIPPYAPEILNPSFLAMIQEANEMNVTEECDLAQVGETDKLCEAMLANELDEDVQSTKFPVVICHSPDDRTVTILNEPDVDANDNLSRFSLGGGLIAPSGDHLSAGVICIFATIYPFSVGYPGIPPNTMEPAEGEGCPGVPTEPPMDLSLMTSPTTPPVSGPPVPPFPTEQASTAMHVSGLIFSFLVTAVAVVLFG